VENFFGNKSSYLPLDGLAPLRKALTDIGQGAQRVRIKPFFLQGLHQVLEFLHASYG
jgi:hypothetical protein